MASILCASTLASHGAETTTPAPSTPASTIAVSLVGWPNITGLTVLADGAAVAPLGGMYTVNKHSRLTLLAEGVELASLPAKPSITLFDLLPRHDCGSSTDLAKLVSLLLSLDSDQNSSNGISIPMGTPPMRSVGLASLSESNLLALEVQLSGRSVALNTALLTVNAALDQETWTESVSTRTSFVNDMSVLQSYLDRVLGAFAFDSTTLDGFSYLAPSEAAKIPATLKSQGMAFDGNTPVFSWRYGLQRTDAATYKPTLAYPLAFPADIQGIYATFGNKPDYGHIGDIDIANGKLYTAIEDEDNTQLQAYIAIFDAKTLQYTGEKHPLPLALHTDGAPWVAVDASRNELYTVTWSGTAANSLNVFDLSTYALIRSVPLQMSFDGRRVQGAKVYDGMLYAAGDSHDSGAAPNTNRKYLYKVDTVSGSVMTLLYYDEPHRTEVEGLGFGPDGTMHVIVIAPYTTPLYATGTKNPKLFDGSYSIDGDDWNPSGTLRHFTRAAEPLRDQLCKVR
ncbi:MAG TPA: hypothetical protein VGN30_13260 [Steroidobacteraceae bacterium]